MSGFLFHPALAAHIGRRRDNNEDAVGYHLPTDEGLLATHGALFLLADGVGGLDGGENASDLAVRALLKAYYESEPTTIEEQLVHAINDVNTQVYQAAQAQDTRNATTLLALVLHDDQMTLASIGDSSGFWLDANGIEKLTTDHVIPIDPANPKKVKLERAIGWQESVKVDVVNGPLSPQAYLILMSDGITRYLEPEDIQSYVWNKPPDQAVESLVRAANQAGGADNISVVIVSIGEPYHTYAQLNEYLNGLPQVLLTIQDDPPPLPMPSPVAIADDVRAPMGGPRNMPTPALPNMPASLPTMSDTPPPVPELAGRSGNRVGVLVAVFLVLVIGGLAAFFVFSSSGDDDGAAEQTIPTSQETNTTAADEALSTEDTPATVEATPVPTVDPTLQVGDEVRFEDSALTYRNLGQSTSSFVIVPGQIYTIQDTFTTRDDVLWYRLYDQDNDQTGWIEEGELPAYEKRP